MPAGAVTTLDSPAVASAASTPAFGPAGTLERAAVERVVDSGLGAFLSHVELEPSLTAGTFRGWSVVRLEPPELWSGVDLQPGDVLTRVNGMGIEREVQAFEAFQAVRQADKLEVSYLREGRPRTLSYVIAGKPSASLPARPPGAKPVDEPARVPLKP